MKISVVIPSYNRAVFLERTIESVIKQTYKNFEIIVVDDESVDNTFEVIDSIKSKYKKIEIKYIKHSKNKGESGARNTGIKESTGDYIAFLDSDDEWAENKLQRQIEFLEETAFKYDGVICEYFQLIAEQNSAEIIKETVKFSRDIITAEDILLKGCGYGIGTNLMLKREKITVLFDEDLRLFADLDWLFRILSNCSIAIQHEPLAYYHKSPMRTGDHVEYHAAIFLKKYINIIKKLSFIKKRRFYSTINWYIALSYDFYNHYGAALRYFILGLINWPFRRPGNYVHICNIFWKLMMKK